MRRFGALRKIAKYLLAAGVVEIARNRRQLAQLGVCATRFRLGSGAARVLIFFSKKLLDNQSIIDTFADPPPTSVEGRLIIHSNLTAGSAVQPELDYPHAQESCF